MAQGTAFVRYRLEKSDVDCAVNWTPWDTCTKACGSGTQDRTHTTTPKQYCGADCDPSELSAPTQQACNTQACPIDCTSSWDTWGPCSPSCGSGNRDRNLIISQPAENGGTPCPVTTFESEGCSGPPCPIDCVSTWENWGSCDVACGSGNRNRNLTISLTAENGGTPCPGTTFASEPCVMPPCVVPIDCISNWEVWGQCDVTCGNGSRNRSLSITQPAENGGTPCPAIMQQVEACTEPACATDCLYSWLIWSSCTVTCGNGTRVRNPLILATPVNGGLFCPDPETSSCFGGTNCIDTTTDQMVTSAAATPTAEQAQSSEIYQTTKIESTTIGEIGHTSTLSKKIYTTMKEEITFLMTVTPSIASSITATKYNDRITAAPLEQESTPKSSMNVQEDYSLAPTQYFSQSTELNTTKATSTAVDASSNINEMTSQIAWLTSIGLSGSYSQNSSDEMLQPTGSSMFPADNISKYSAWHGIKPSTDVTSIFRTQEHLTHSEPGNTVGTMHTESGFLSSSSLDLFFDLLNWTTEFLSSNLTNINIGNFSTTVTYLTEENNSQDRSTGHTPMMDTTTNEDTYAENLSAATSFGKLFAETSQALFTKTSAKPIKPSVQSVTNHESSSEFPIKAVSETKLATETEAETGISAMVSEPMMQPLPLSSTAGIESSSLNSSQTSLSMGVSKFPSVSMEAATVEVTTRKPSDGETLIASLNTTTGLFPTSRTTTISMNTPEATLSQIRPEESTLDEFIGSTNSYSSLISEKLVEATESTGYVSHSLTQGHLASSSMPETYSATNDSTLESFSSQMMLHATSAIETRTAAGSSEAVSPKSSMEASTTWSSTATQNASEFLESSTFKTSTEMYSTITQLQTTDSPTSSRRNTPGQITSMSPFVASTLAELETTTSRDALEATTLGNIYVTTSLSDAFVTTTLWNAFETTTMGYALVTTTLSDAFMTTTLGDKFMATTAQNNILASTLDDISVARTLRNVATTLRPVFETTTFRHASGLTASEPKRAKTSETTLPSTSAPSTTSTMTALSVSQSNLITAASSFLPSKMEIFIKTTISTTSETPNSSLAFQATSLQSHSNAQIYSAYTDVSTHYDRTESVSIDHSQTTLPAKTFEETTAVQISELSTRKLSTKTMTSLSAKSSKAELELTTGKRLSRNEETSIATTTLQPLSSVKPMNVMTSPLTTSLTLFVSSMLESDTTTLMQNTASVVKQKMSPESHPLSSKTSSPELISSTATNKKRTITHLPKRTKCETELPDGTVTVILGSQAEGNHWPTDARGKSGLGENSPYFNGKVSASLLPNGSVIYKAVSKDNPESNPFLCSKVPESGKCPTKSWVLQSDTCYIIERNDQTCKSGEPISISDPVLKQPDALERIKNAAPCNLVHCKNKGACTVSKEKGYCNCGFKATGTKCEILLPEDANLMKLGLKANGRKWPFDTDTMPGLGEEAPFENAEIATTKLDDGTMVYIPLDPAAPQTKKMTTFCKKDSVDGKCPEHWLKYGKTCFALQEAGPGGMCFEGNLVGPSDSILSNPDAMSALSNSSPLKSPLKDIDKTDCWGPCSTTCGLGSRYNLHPEPVCSTYPETQLCQLIPCPINCNYTWQKWGMCSLTCGGGIQYKTPAVNVFPKYGGKKCPGVQKQECNILACPTDPPGVSFSTISTTKTTPSPTTTTYFTTTPVFPLDKVEKVAADVMQTLGCSFILAALGVTIGIFLILRDFSYERCLHMQMEIALLIAHILVLSMRDKVEWTTACKLASVGLQYFFIASFAFMLLEAIQAYAVATNVISSKGYFSRFQSFLLGWCGSAVITGISAAKQHNEYTSYWSCWTNLGSSVAYASLVPIGCLAAVTIIVSEASGMGNFTQLPSTNIDKLTAALTNAKGLVIILPVSVASWFTGLFAVYYANLAMFGLVSALNMALGITVFMFHTLGNPEVHAVFKRMMAKIGIKLQGDPRLILNSRGEAVKTENTATKVKFKRFI